MGGELPVQNLKALRGTCRAGYYMPRRYVLPIKDVCETYTDFMSSSLQCYMTYTARVALKVTVDDIDKMNVLSATPAFVARAEYIALSPPKISLLRAEGVRSCD
jgi:hypothetical protein